ncbi:YoaK family protein [Fusobacterium sp. PH5-44]|uniref:YoaK family protein n=1 Tax=unclassified Fusobacterium TaxID=2648384 RepID=UPI003D1D0F11
MNTKKIHVSESFIVGSILAIVGGYLDAYTYVIRGGVLANAQTGNIVLLAMSIADLDWVNSIFYLIPILSFIVGILATEYAKKLFIERGTFHWRHIMLIIEIIILIIVSFIPHGSLDFVANILISLTCAIQVESFRNINGNPYATTMCTGNLRSGTEKLFFSVISKSKDERKSFRNYYSIILFFILGVILGNFLTKYFTEKSILFPIVGLLLVFILMIIKDETNI